MHYLCMLQYCNTVTTLILIYCRILKQFVDYCAWTLLRMMNFQVLWLFSCLIMNNFELTFLSMCFGDVGNMKIDDKGVSHVKNTNCRGLEVLLSRM